MRIGELIGLTWDCVDFENEVIYVEKAAGADPQEGTEVSLRHPQKRQDPRHCSRSLHHAGAQKAQNRSGGAAAPDGRPLESGEFPNLVFTHKDGSHYSQPTIWKEFQDILAAAGLEHHRVHDLRHTFAVNSLRAGDDIKNLQENMGHYSAAFTLDRYGHVTDTMRRESANRMQAFIENM